jgi:hypothetical protein
MELGELPAGWETAELSEIVWSNPTMASPHRSANLARGLPMPMRGGYRRGQDPGSTFRVTSKVLAGRSTPFYEGDVLLTIDAQLVEEPSFLRSTMALASARQSFTSFAHPGISPQFLIIVSGRAPRSRAQQSGAVGQRR